MRWRSSVRTSCSRSPLMRTTIGSSPNFSLSSSVASNVSELLSTSVSASPFGFRVKAPTTPRIASSTASAITGPGRSTHHAPMRAKTLLIRNSAYAGKTRHEPVKTGLNPRPTSTYARAAMEGALEPLPVTLASADAVADSVAQGFHDNELWCWILPDSQRRQRLLHRYYRTTVRHVFVPRRTAWTSPDCAGGALWFAPGELSISPLQTLRELAVLAPALGVRGMRRALAIETVKRRHRPSEDHWYLETLSIAPARQRSGVGTALITPRARAMRRRGATGLPRDPAPREHPVLRALRVLAAGRDHGA